MAARPWRVMLVDDQPEVRSIIEELLGALGCVVGHAASGDEALVAAPAFDPDAICLDLWTDGTPGLEVLSQLRDRDATVPIIVITADPLQETMTRARALGAFACLSKPFDSHEVVRTVAAALARRRFPARGTAGAGRSS